MRAVSSRFLQTLRGSHTAITRVTAVTGFQTGTTPTGTVLEVTSGDVTLSATNQIRATAQLTTTAAWPTAADDLLAPYGQELYIERGVTYGNGQREFVGLGYFRINTPEQDEVPDGEITIAATDRMSGIVDARFLAPRQFGSTMSRGSLVSVLVNEVYPSATIEWDSTVIRDGVIGRTIVGEEDRAQLLTDFVTSLGKVGYFDHRGVFVIKTPPDPTGAASWTIDAGQDGVLVQLSRSLTREQVYNVVVATGEAADTVPPARGIAVNLDPDSPTYYLGPFGPVPMFYSSPFLMSNAQAATAARQLLVGKIGLPYQITLNAIANSALEPLDVVAVAYPRTARNRSLITEKHVLDEVKIGLGNHQPVSLETREQRVVLIGDIA